MLLQLPAGEVCGGTTDTGHFPFFPAQSQGSPSNDIH